MDLEVPYRGLFIEIHKDIDPYEPKSMPDIYIDGNDVFDEALMEKEQQDYLSGDVYGYVLLDNNKQIIDSIWGFFGKIEDLDIIDRAKERIDTFYKYGQLSD